MNSPNYSITERSALFLDRDGVINELRPEDYVKHISEFKLLPEVIPALTILRPMFHRIVVVTNQQGIGKGLMLQPIETIHEHFLSLIPENLHPDRIYHCPHLKTLGCSCRKPMPGMALMAKNDFPEIHLQESIMVGDSLSDMEFASNAGIQKAFISNDPEKIGDPGIPVFGDLLEFARSLVRK